MPIFRYLALSAAAYVALIVAIILTAVAGWWLLNRIVYFEVEPLRKWALRWVRRGEKIRKLAARTHQRLGRRPRLRAALYVSLSATLAFGSVLTGIEWYVYYSNNDDVDVHAILRWDPLQIGHIRDSTGIVLIRLTTVDGEYRRVVPYDAIPEHVRDAFVAAEDGDFWTNDGWERDRTMIATLKVAFNRLGYRLQGGSTITQQVVRKIDPVIAELAAREKRDTLIVDTLPVRLFRAWKGTKAANRAVRKWPEIRHAVQLQRMLEEYFRAQDAAHPRIEAKKLILNTYLNLICFGDGVYGVDFAAQHFFQKNLQDLTVAEAAQLASLLPAPEKYIADQAGLTYRRDQVLVRMSKRGYLNTDQLRVAQSAPTTWDIRIAHVKTDAPAAVNTVLRELPKTGHSQEKLLRGQVQVTTTLRADLQQILNESVQHGLYGNGKPGSGWVGRYPGVEVPQVSAVFLGIQADILSIYGGETRDPKFQYNAHQNENLAYALNQPGSTMKMIDSTAAIMAGFTPDTPVSVEPIAVCMRKDIRGRCAEWKKVGNYEEEGGAMNIREITARSINTGYMRLMRDMVGHTAPAAAEAALMRERLHQKVDPGAAWAIKWASLLGVETPLQPYISTVLGASDVTVVDMANVIHSIGTGRRGTPYIISRIVDNTGHELYTNDGHLTPLPIPPEKLTLEQALLYGVVRLPKGTGHSLDTAEFGIEVGGKSGTTDDFRDAWWCGYVQDTLYGCVHVGYNDNHSMPGEGLPIWRRASGAWVALPIWREFVERSVGPGKPLGVAPKLPDAVKENVNTYRAVRYPDKPNS